VTFFTIIDPALQLNQLEQVQRDVATLLEQGLNPVRKPQHWRRMSMEATAEKPSTGGNGNSPRQPRRKGIEEAAMN